MNFSWWSKYVMPPGAHRRARFDCYMYLLFTLLPLMAIVVANWVRPTIENPGAVVPLWPIVFASVASGQLLFYSLSAYGAAGAKIWPDDGIKTRWNGAITIVIIICAVLATLLLGLDPTARRLNHPFVHWTSGILFLISVVLIYYISVKTSPPDAPNLEAQDREQSESLRLAIRKAKGGHD